MFKSLHSPEYKHLIAWLKEHREAQGLTMRQLGALLDEPHSFVGKVEQGERRIDVLEYVKYCRALGVAPEEGIAIVDKLLPS